MMVYTRTHAEKVQMKAAKKQEETKVAAVSEKKSLKKKGGKATPKADSIGNTSFLKAVSHVLRNCNEKTNQHIREVSVELGVNLFDGQNVISLFKQISTAKPSESVTLAFKDLTNYMNSLSDRSAEIFGIYEGSADQSCHLLSFWQGKLEAHLKSTLASKNVVDGENVVFTFNSKVNAQQDVPVNLKLAGGKLYRLAGVVYPDHAIVAAAQGKFQEYNATGESKANACVTKDAVMIVYTRNTDKEEALKNS